MRVLKQTILQWYPFTIQRSSKIKIGPSVIENIYRYNILYYKKYRVFDFQRVQPT